MAKIWVTVGYLYSGIEKKQGTSWSYFAGMNIMPRAADELTWNMTLISFYIRTPVEGST